MTREEIVKFAHEMVLDSIEENMQDRMGILERVDIEIPDNDAEAITDEVVEELTVVRLSLEKLWGLS